MTFPPGSIYARLLAEGYRFNFYQAVRLLERLFAEAPPPGASTRAQEERIRFRPDSAMVFPVADVREVNWQPATERRGARAEVVATFLGLYGIDAPLPEVFHTPITIEKPGSEALRAFLDVFNQRFYAYFYRAWKKYRPNLHALEARPTRGREPQADLQRFLAVSGLGTPHADTPPVPTAQLAAYAAHLAPRVRNPEGLSHLLEAFLGGVAVRIREFVPRWVRLPHRERLGRRPGMQVGRTAVVGERVYDVAGKFRIELGPMGLADYTALLPGGPKAELVQGLVRTYTAGTLAFDAELILWTAELPRLRLGGRRAQLGLTTYLGQPRDVQLRRVVRYPSSG